MGTEIAVRPNAVVDTLTMYQIADILNATVRRNGYTLSAEISKVSTKIHGLTMDLTPTFVAGCTSEDYAAVNLHVGGDLYLYICVIPSHEIKDFTTLYISSKSPSELLRSAFEGKTKPIPLTDFMKLLTGNIKRGYYTDATKRWLELPKTAHLDLCERGHIDVSFRGLLKVLS